jgi:DNA-binding response OmpR family regulator
MTSWLLATALRRMPTKPASPGKPSASQPSPLRRPHSVLVIEDQIEIAELIKMHLEDLPGKVTAVLDGYEGLVEARSGRYDLIVLDIRLPRCDGLEICQTLRSEGILTPILVVSSKGADTDRILGLQLGADDFLPKPFNVAELVARAKALLRRTEYASRDDTAPRQAELRISDVLIDPSARRVVVGSREIDLTAREFDLLHLLAKHPGRVFTRAQILEAIWKSPYERYEHNVNCQINRLRLKIEQNSRAPRYIVTVWGVGYKFVG